MGFSFFHRLAVVCFNLFIFNFTVSSSQLLKDAINWVDTVLLTDVDLLESALSAAHAQFNFSDIRNEMQKKGQLMFNDSIDSLSDHVLHTSNITEDLQKKGEFIFTDKDKVINERVLRDPYLNLKPEEIIRKAGYPVEIHNATTEDGFVITLFRIPHGKEYPKIFREPILLMPGFSVSADSWILVSAERALPFLLADEGYDVWLGNYRGNDFARKHLKYNVNQLKYWKFSFEQIGLYDVPAQVDYILDQTGEKKLSYVGHSMGCGSGFITLSMKPEYNAKIQKFVALAPFAFFHHTKMPLRYVSVIPDKVTLSVMDRVTQGRLSFYEANFISKLFAPATCLIEAPDQLTCGVVLLNVLGFAPIEYNRTTVARGLRRFPTVNSVRTLVHAFQQVRKAGFRRFDFGSTENMIKYGNLMPPKYNFRKVTVPVYGLYGKEDLAVVPQDCMTTFGRVKNCVNLETAAVNYENFTHVDFLFHDKVKTLVYDRVINFLNNYSDDESSFTDIS